MKTRQELRDNYGVVAGRDVVVFNCAGFDCGSKKTIDKFNFVSGCDCVQYDDPVHQDHLNRRYAGLLFMCITSSVVFAVWYPALFHWHPLSVHLSAMVAGGFTAASIALIRYRNQAKLRIHENLMRLHIRQLIKRAIYV